jgi:Big-like domain-containing protein
VVKCPRTLTCLISLLLILLIIACGGGAGNTVSTPPPPAPDFSMSVTSSFSSTSVSMVQGSTSVPVTVAIVGANGFNESVSISISGLPPGTSTSPASPITVFANSSQTFTVASSSDTPVGDSRLTLHATSASLAHDATITLSINPPAQTSQSGTVLYLQSYSSGHTARIGLETAWGGAIVEVSLDGTNFVNAHDTGREVQPALWDGAGRYDNCGGCTGVCGWNPTLAGDTYNHGSPVLAQQLAADSLYVKAQPLQGVPDCWGGGPNTPVPADAYFEQTVSVVPGAPFAFKMHLTLTHFGTDQHYNNWQEFPAVYVNSAYGTLIYYGGTAPWTRDVATKTAVPANPGTLLLYSPERWAANVDSNDVGLSVFVPVSYPYEVATWFPGSGGSGPTGDATYYQRPWGVATIGPGAVIEGDVYLIAGDYASARDAVYGLHQLLPAAPDIFSPMIFVDTPTANATMSGNNFQVSGWAFDDSDVSNVSVFVDGLFKGNATYGSNRADVANTWPHAPANIGWAFSLDSTQLTNGAHTITIHATDTSNNEAILAPISITVRCARFRAWSG